MPKSVDPQTHEQPGSAILLGIFSKRMNREGAIAGMVVGLTFTFAYIVYFKFVAPGDNNAAHWWLGISPEGIGMVGALANFATAAIVSRFASPAPEDVQQLVEKIRIPRGVETPHTH